MHPSRLLRWWKSSRTNSVNQRVIKPRTTGGCPQYTTLLYTTQRNTSSKIIDTAKKSYIGPLHCGQIRAGMTLRSLNFTIAFEQSILSFQSSGTPKSQRASYTILLALLTHVIFPTIPPCGYFAPFTIGCFATLTSSPGRPSKSSSIVRSGWAFFEREERLAGRTNGSSLSGGDKRSRKRSIWSDLFLELFLDETGLMIRFPAA